MARYALTIFLGSLLLFQVQPLIGKYILPWFGGSPAVWTTCMLSFQVMLLAGYLYAYLLDRWLTPLRQGLLHIVLLAASLLLLPIIPSEAWAPTGGQTPTWRILCLLAVTIGGPYVLLATTGPLLQSWFARTHPGRSPYRLYALSNVGSLTALVSYPFVIEPVLTLPDQARSWSVAFAVFAVLCGLCSGGVCRWAASRSVTDPVGPVGDDSAGDDNSSPPEPESPGWPTVLTWVALTACGSVVLLATTNQMCQEVSVVPFLWVLPLALYLGTFIVCFDNPRWYPRSLFGVLLIAAVVGACIVLSVGVSVPLWGQIVVYSSVLTVCCMVCHGELVRLKPSPRHLTGFYLMVAGGGALGGVLVTLLAPLLFPAYWEYHLGLSVCCLLLLVAIYRDRGWPLFGGRPRWAWAVLLVVFGCLTTALAVHVWKDSQDPLIRLRNFYGVLQVIRYDGEDPTGPYHILQHGQIKHGLQFIEGDQRTWPTSYYGRETGVGMAVGHHPGRSVGGLRIGVIGLGAGTLAAYGEPSDLIRFYEINPDVVGLSREYFTYREDCAAKVEIVLGDARVSLQRELRDGKAGDFDVLVVDAFSSDAIPIHLLTRECFELYHSHLRPDGILAVHVSNRHLALEPMVRRLALEIGREAVLFDTDDDDPLGVDRASWVLVTDNQEFLDGDDVSHAIEPWPDDGPLPAAWTDSFSNILEVLND